MENIFDNLFPITNKKAENNKIIKLEMEIEKLRLCLRMSQTANNQRKEAMDIMKKRLEEQEALIKRLHSALKKQDIAMQNLRQTMKSQQEKIEYIEKIDAQMEVVNFNQTQILNFAKQYKQA